MTSANTPLGVVLKVALVVLGVELAIMLAIENLQPVFGDQVAPVFWTFLDPILLTIIVASALYVFVFRSMQLQQAELRRQYDALRVAAITFEVHDAIIITDAIGNIIRVNRAFSDVTGYSPEEVIGKNQRIMDSGRQGKDFHIERWQQLIHAGSWSGEVWNRHKTGQIYPKWLDITAVRNDRQEAINFVGVFSDITEHKQADEELRNLAFYDVLTRLPNRRLYLDRFRTALPISARDNNFGASLFVDLDHFKSLNDTLGYDCGDLMLIEAARRIKACVRNVDTVARLGGDEFAVLIENAGADQDEASHQGMMVAEKIRAELLRPYEIDGHELHSSASIGICLYHGSELPADVLLQHAEVAMYQAKQAGRNGLRFFDSAMQDKANADAALARDLRRAIAQHELQLYYQIQVGSTHCPQGAEILLRWNHPQHGLIPPAQFIPLAEETGMILPIGQWVLDMACAQLKAWRDVPEMRLLQLAVNVSAKQFRQADFVETVIALVEWHDINPLLLKLELTESVVLDNIDDAIAKMRLLKNYGVKLSLDDFGTGYSSLSYLKDLPLDQIKIDQAFVRDLTADRRNMVMIQTIVDLGINFELEVIAEGVETEAQLKLLRRWGCASFQGFLFSKPVPLEQFEQLVLTQGCFVNLSAPGAAERCLKPCKD